METVSREIIVYKLYAQNDSTKGYLRAVAEKQNDTLIALNSENFCPSEKIFVTSAYDEIDQKYQKFELFKITVTESQFRTLDVRQERNCTYVARGFNNEALKPRELIEIIIGELPSPNYMVVDIKHIPSTNYIYLVDKKDHCFGPFKWEVLEGQEQLLLKKIDSPMPGRSLYSGNIFKGDFNNLTQHVITCELSEGARLYFKDLTNLHNDTNLSSIDYSSDEDIVNVFSKIAKELNFTNKKADFVFLEAQIKKFPKYNQKNILEKLSRFKDINNDNDIFKNQVIESFDKFLKSNLGEKIIQTYIESHKEDYLLDIKANYRSEIEHEYREKQKELSDLKVKIDQNKNELIELGKEIEGRNRVKFDSELIDNTKKNSDLINEINQKTEKLEILNKEHDTLLKKYTTIKNYDNLEKLLEDTKRNYQYEIERRIEINKETKKLESLYREADDNLRSKLFELKPFVEAINGNVYKTSTTLEMDVTTNTFNLDLSNDDNPVNIVSHFEKELKKLGRNLSIIEIINLIVVVQQSFITFLAGLPGGGKTTLVRLLSKVQGIYEKRFIEVPVARGWTGQKDLIGFFNPISNKFQPSSTGLYQYLIALDKDKENEAEKPLSYILLDEANLSPIEHYWSSFMGISDIKGDKGIRLGDDNITIPDNLRFIATINYDSTTEYLSQRILDRAPVIVLEGNPLLSNYIQEDIIDSIHKIQTPISYNIMEYYFGLSENIPEFTDKEKRIFDQIKIILEDKNFEFGKSIQISNRKEIAIRQYCNKARPLMRSYSDDNDIMAIDFAILQLILPQIKGNGKPFSNRLIKLKDILSSYDLERSVEYLDIIINNGNVDLHTYDFFCW